MLFLKRTDVWLLIGGRKRSAPSKTAKGYKPRADMEGPVNRPCNVDRFRLLFHIDLVRLEETLAGGFDDESV